MKFIKNVLKKNEENKKEISGYVFEFSKLEHSLILSHLKKTINKTPHVIHPTLEEINSIINDFENVGDKTDL